MKRLATLFFLVFFSSCVMAEECPAAPAKIEKAIHRHIAELKAYEYCDARKVKAEGGITVAIYTAEGACAGFSTRAKPGTCSNMWIRYMVALVGERVTAPIKIGGKGGLTDNSVKISEGIVEVSGLSIGPNDPMCCPTVPETKRYKVSHFGVTEIRP